jgi:hypothetical protein
MVVGVASFDKMWRLWRDATALQLVAHLHMISMEQQFAKWSRLSTPPFDVPCVFVESADDVLWIVPMTLQIVASLKSYGNQQQIAWSSLLAIASMQQSTLLKLIIQCGGVRTVWMGMQASSPLALYGK